MKALDIRNQEGVRNAMFNGNLVTIEQFLVWIERLKKDLCHREYLVFDSENLDDPLGVLCLNEIDQINKTTNWAIFLAQKEQSKLGAILEWFLINYVFDELQLEKLNCQVLEINESVLKLHKKFFFQQEGFLRDHVIRGQQKLGAYCLGLTKSDWAKYKHDFLQEHEKLRDRYDIQLQESYEPKNLMLKQIEDAREAYNLSLGMLLRLSLENRHHNKVTIADFLKVQEKALALEKELLAIVEPIVNDQSIPKD
jgi:UDP-4-amino-4,6-dideoxy-N-acetyl-beta-L-altrosamine N-acetyltransferase